MIASDGRTLGHGQRERRNNERLAIAYHCVTQDTDPESDPSDYICRPVSSKAARRFDDGTIPRFHRFGTDDETTPKVGNSIAGLTVNWLVPLVNCVLTSESDFHL